MQPQQHAIFFVLLQDNKQTSQQYEHLPQSGAGAATFKRTSGSDLSFSVLAGDALMSFLEAVSLRHNPTIPPFTDSATMPFGAS